MTTKKLLLTLTIQISQVAGARVLSVGQGGEQTAWSGFGQECKQSKWGQNIQTTPSGCIAAKMNRVCDSIWTGQGMFVC